MSTVCLNTFCHAGSANQETAMSSIPVIMKLYRVGTSADSGPDKPENPNICFQTRQTRTRKTVKNSKPDKPEPEGETRGYPKVL